jgi:glycosyltransferase involved in cell wall biosynthesis
MQGTNKGRSEGQPNSWLLDIPISEQADYQTWLASRFPSHDELEEMRAAVLALQAKPLLSVVVPVYNPPIAFLEEAIESVLDQIYPDWELCLVDDGSNNEAVAVTLGRYAASDSRIRTQRLPENRGIVAASNAGLEMVRGEFVVLLDHDDLITPDALYEIARALNEAPETDMIYSDEDKVDIEGKLSGPIFKPDWCPDSLLSRLYTCHLSAYRRQLVMDLGGFRAEYEGGQDYDLALRVSERARAIKHIPKILYHWRMHSGSTAADSGQKIYGYEAGQRALRDALARRGEPARVERVPGELGFYLIRYALLRHPRISVIIPSRDYGAMLHRALESIFTRTEYSDYEVIVVDNGSTEPRAMQTLDDWTKREPQRLRVARLDIPFNFSTLCNHGVDVATGEILVFLNNDIEIITGDWLSAMLEQAQRPSIGAVGALLLFADGSIQHAGAIIGLGGLAAHSHRTLPGISPGYMHQVFTINNYSSLAGACLMCRRAVFDEMSRFDEQLPGDYEDVDLCLKLVRAGYNNVYLPHVRLYHYEGASRGKDYVERDPEGRRHAMELIQTRWPDFIEHDPCYSPNLTRDREDYGLRIEGVDVVDTRLEPRLSRFIACLDRAAVIDRRTLLLRGWALTNYGAAPARIEVAVSGKPCGDAALGYARDDVRDAHPAAHHQFLAFYYTHKFAEPLPPRITIRVTLHDPRGGEETFTLGIETSREDHLGAASVLKRSVAQLSAAGTRKAVSALAVIVAGRAAGSAQDPRRATGDIIKHASARLGVYESLQRRAGPVRDLADRLGLDIPPTRDPGYAAWLWRQYPRRAHLDLMRAHAASFLFQPTISILMPVYNIERRYLVEAIESVLAQTYPNFELCIADDASPSPHVQRLLRSYARRDKRIKVDFRLMNGGISEASNSALSLASGEFVAQLDHDDILAPHALHQVVTLLNQYPDADFIYSDEDKIDLYGVRSNPFFKPDWSPDTLLTKMYTCHFAVYRRALVEAIGGFRKAFDGGEDYDLALRLTERTGRIFHLADVLYSWRTHPLSTATGEHDVKTWAYDASQRALEDALKRRGEPGSVERVQGCLGYYRVRYDVAAHDLVSIVIPTRDSPRNLDRCLLSILERSRYPRFEIVVVDNGSREPEVAGVLEKWQSREPVRFRMIRDEAPFNHSRLVNAGVTASAGAYLLLLDDDTEVITPDWLESLVAQAQRPSIGAVGAQLLYRDNTIQHAGIVVGVMGSAGHAERRAPADYPGYFGRIATVQNVAAVTGACLMCRRDLYESVGGFDEAFDSPYDDVDFCLRLHERGLRNVYVPEAKLYHAESESFRRLSSEDRAARLRKGRALLMERWPAFVARDPYYNPNLTRRGERFEIA